jgi:peptidyl-tRNA hydrolase, PTH1 family
MKWIVGLGNPGTQYKDTRHNIGFKAVDQFAERLGISISQSKFRALVGEGNFQGEKVYLIKPMTYMNLSGETVRQFMDFYKASLEDFIVVYDDLDTPFGQQRLRYQGSAGGHNGIKSIIQHVGTQTFNRVRLGISRPEPGYDIADYVLSNFSKKEAAELAPVLDKCCDSLEFALKNPFDKVMAKFNG